MRRFTRHLIAAALLLAVPVGGLHALSYNPTPCVPSVVKTKYTWDAEPIHRWLTDLSKKAEDVPWVKEFSASLLGSAELEVGEECCPGAASPSVYKEGKIDLKAKLNAEFFLPPPYSLVGGKSFDVKSPGWFGKPWVLGSGKIKWGLGPFGGFNGEISIFGDKFRISDCTGCFQFGVGGQAKGKGGVAGQLTWEFSVGGRAPYKGQILVEGAVTTAVKAEGKIGVPKTPKCGYVAKICWDGFSIEVKVKFKIGGLGSFNWTKVFGPVLSGCK